MVKVHEVVRVLQSDGWMLIRVRGSHQHFRHPIKKGIVTVPGKRNEDLAIGTLKSILKQAQIRWS
jgi:predicted RNA binding protein YcfA (HicA-like mRNA interferase family)